MVDSHQLERSRAIQKRTGTTFYFATRFLPRRVREQTYVLYAFFRLADEIVDDPDTIDRPAAEKREDLESFRAGALGEAETDEPVLEAFREVKARNGIPDEEVHAFVDAMAADADTRRYESFDELRAYMRGSAAAVGAMMTAIMDPANRERALPHARSLGEAFQLTNFLRDVREDVRDRDRIYLPEETFRRHGSSHRAVADLEPTDGVRAAIRAELERTEQFYRHGVSGIELLPRDCQFPVLLAAVLYADYHRSIRANDYDVLTTPPTLTGSRTLWLALRTRTRWATSKDPVGVFRSTSSVEHHRTDPRVTLGEPVQVLPQ